MPIEEIVDTVSKAGQAFQFQLHEHTNVGLGRADDLVVDVGDPSPSEDSKAPATAVFFDSDEAVQCRVVTKGVLPAADQVQIGNDRPAERCIDLIDCCLIDSVAVFVLPKPVGEVEYLCRYVSVT